MVSLLTSPIVARTIRRLSRFARTNRKFATTAQRSAPTSRIVMTPARGASSNGAIHLHSALEKITIGQLGADPLRRLRGEARQRQLKVAARCTVPSNSLHAAFDWMTGLTTTGRDM